MPDIAVQLEGVSKRYQGHVAVHDLSLSVPRGLVYGLLGPNGAGKTTTIRMIMGIVKADAGRVTVLGNPGGGWNESARIGYLPEERGLYRKMKVMDVLMFLAEAKGVGRGRARQLAGAWLERLGLADWSSHKVDQLSKGMQQKVQFIATVLHGPDLIILDEPFAGLDPVNSQVMKDAVLAMAREGRTVLFSTHIMDQAERLCDAVCIIARGSKVLDGTVPEVKRTHGGRHIAVAVEQGLPAISAVLDDRSLVTRADRYGQYAELELAAGADPQVLLRRLVESGASVTRFELVEPSLHKIFIDRVGGAATASRVEAA
jgi:ABC-2 type transport system ATP-binding protein